MMMHNCIEGMEEPLYGFVTQVMIVNDQPCELNITCTERGDTILREFENNNQTVDGNFKYQTVFNIWSRQYHQLSNTNIDRQEEFTASGPPRCRTRRDPSNRCRT